MRWPALARYANGDARIALNMLETAAAAAGAGGRIDVALVADLAQNRALLYDKSGEEHYNLISALHKSMRNSDPDATVYWLARMVEAGEDPLYIARRLVRFASEDIGNADPRALTTAIAAKDAVHFLGMPEANTALAQAAIYMAVAAKEQRRLPRVPRGGRSRVTGSRRAGAAAPAKRADEADEGSRVRQGLPLRARRGRGRLPPTWSACPPRTPAGASTSPPSAGSRRRSKDDWRGCGRSGNSVRLTGPQPTLLHLPQHLRAQRKDEREAIVPLHPSDRDADELALAIEDAAAGDAGVTVGQTGHEVEGVRWPTYPVERMIPFE